MMTSYNMGCNRRVVTVSLIYLVLCCFLPVIRGQSEWLEKPEPQTVPVGGNATFVCKSPSLSLNIVWTKETALFVNGQRLSDSIPRRFYLQDNYTLVISNVQKTDAGSYGCSVLDFGSASALLTVLLPPGPPVITVDLTGEIFREGQTPTFTCSSSGGTPAPTITWMKNGLEMTNADPVTQSGTVTRRSVTVTMDYTDNGANYSCFVYNLANEGRPLVASRLLAVEYSPKISFEPSSPYTVRLDERAEFTCQVDAHPPVYSVNWEKDGVTFPGTSKTQVFNSVKRTDAGNYSCIASNSLNSNNPSRQSIKLVVVYPPIVSVGPSTRDVSESNSLTVSCTVDAKPPAIETKWVKVLPDGSVRHVVNGNTLRFTQIRREDAGNYSCRARNYLTNDFRDMASGEAYVYINVKYPPGPAKISPVEPINVGEPLEIRCSASPEGYPPARYRWRKNGESQSKEDGVFRISQTLLSDNGVYMCTPFNDVDEGASAQISINVNEPPRLTLSLAIERTIRITDTQPLSLTCKGQGRPRPSIHWSKDSLPDLSTLQQYYRVESDWTVKDTYSYEVTSTLHFSGAGRAAVPSGEKTGLRIEDLGNYTCRVMSLAHENIIPSSTQELFVQFKPVLPQTFGKVAVNVGGDAVLPCEAQSHPVPVFQWYRDGVQVDTSGTKFSIRAVQVNDTPSAYKSVLTIRNTGAGDYGIYFCFVSNFLGNISNTINVTRKSLPEAPTSLQTLNRTWESIYLQWNPGFDGGYPQQFQVYVQEVGSTTPKFPTLQAGSDVHMNVTGLWPSTRYEFSIVGRNELGFGQRSLTLTSYTRDLEIPTLGEATPVYNTATKQLVIGAQPASQYCLKIEAKSGGKWETVKSCTKLLGSGTMEIPSAGITAINVSVCLMDRPEICGIPTAASISQPDSSPKLTVEDVIIIACVCAVIIITLLIILICFICKRRRANAKEYYNSSGGHPPTANGGVPGMKPQPQHQQQSYDNPDGRADGYRGQQETITMHGRPQSPNKGYIDLEDRKDPSVQSQESGYSTGDPNKPKKVIYEVVV